MLCVIKIILNYQKIELCIFINLFYNNKMESIMTYLNEMVELFYVGF